MARIALLQEIFVEYIGYMSMSAVLKLNGHIVEIFIDDQKDNGDFLDEIRAFKPDIVGYSVLSSSIEWALNSAKIIKENIDTITIFGNLYILLHQELINDSSLDILCIGEGEFPLVELASKLDSGENYNNIVSLIVKTPQGIIKNPVGPVVDVNELPFLDRDVYDKYDTFRHSNNLKVALGRGCPFQCSFCACPFQKEYYGAKNYIRKMTPERAIEEILYHVKKRKPNYIYITDEVLWIENNWLRHFLSLYKEKIGLDFLCSYRWGPIEEDDIRLLSESGVYWVALATESGNEEKRITVLNKKDKENEWQKQQETKKQEQQNLAYCSVV